MGEKIHDAKTERFLLLLKREIEHAAARLIKMRPRDALGYAHRQVDYLGENGGHEDYVYWERIAIEVDRQLHL